MKGLWKLVCIVTGLALVIGACGTAIAPPTAEVDQPISEVIQPTTEAAQAVAEGEGLDNIASRLEI